MFLSRCFIFFIRAVIEGRVIRKSDMFTYSNGTGKFFTFDLADLTGEIRCKAFNSVANTFFDEIVKGNVFDITHVLSVSLVKVMVSLLGLFFKSFCLELCEQKI